MARTTLSRGIKLAGGLLAFALPFTLTFAGAVPTPRVLVTWPDGGRDPSTPPPVRTSGRELVFVYVGSSTCTFSNRDDLPEIVRRLEREVGRKARTHGLGFATIGIAKDMRVHAGLAHLAKFGEFDEVMTGRGWLNTGAVKYLFQDVPGPAGTPQIVVVERYVEQGRDTGIGRERLVARKVGYSEIRRWLDFGAPLPRLRQSGLAGAPAGALRGVSVPASTPRSPPARSSAPAAPAPPR